MGNFTECVVEDASLAWLESLGYRGKHGPEIRPGGIFTERSNYGQVVLAGHLRDMPLTKRISAEPRVNKMQTFMRACSKRVRQ